MYKHGKVDRKVQMKVAVEKDMLWHMTDKQDSKTREDNILIHIRIIHIV